MSVYSNKNIIIDKANKFCKFLNSKNFESYVINETLREYNVKISINNQYKGNLYYSPKANRFKLVTNEIKDPVIEGILEDLWLEFNSESVTYVADQQYFNEVYNNFTHIYVDGSYKNGGFGYGYAVIKNDSVVHKEYGVVDEEVFRTQRNIGGEFVSVISALRYCKKNNIENVIIYFDYWGISKFVNGSWKPKSESSEAYLQRFNEIGINPVFVKVEAHQSVKWNEFVDQLAKQGSDLDPNKKIFESEFEIKNKQANLIAEEFSTYLLAEGIENEVLVGKNLYGSRVKVFFENKSSVYFDIYDSKKRKINDPYISNANNNQKELLLNKYSAFLEKNPSY